MSTRGHTAEIGLRALTDFVVFHSAMLIALAVIALSVQNTNHESLASLRWYYLTVFLPFSPFLTVVYALVGIYSGNSRVLPIRAKLRQTTIAAAIGAVGLCLITFVMPGTDQVSRIAAVVASILILMTTPGIRFIKHLLFEREKLSLRARNSGATVLVVGGAGYIGSILVRKLLDRGYRVRVLDNLVYGDYAIAGVRTHSRFEFVKGDCRNIQDVVGVMAGVHSVVHLAAIVGDPACDRDHQTALEINYAATRMMIEIAKGERVSRFVFASSCSVYGSSDELMDEGSEARPLSLYAETKIDSEQALLAAATSDFYPTVLRFSTIFGLSPRPRFDLVVNLLTAKAMQEGVVTIYNGQQWRPFLHVADAAEAVIRALETPAKIVSGQVYNVGDDRLNHTLSEIAAKIQKLFPGTQIENVANSDLRNYRVSFEKIREDMGYRCSKTVEEGIRELKRAFERGLISDYLDPVYSNVKFLQQNGSPVQTDEVGVQVMAALARKGHAMALAQKA